MRPRHGPAGEPDVALHGAGSVDEEQRAWSGRRRGAEKRTAGAPALALARAPRAERSLGRLGDAPEADVADDDEHAAGRPDGLLVQLAERRRTHVGDRLRTGRPPSVRMMAEEATHERVTGDLLGLAPCEDDLLGDAFALDGDLVGGKGRVAHDGAHELEERPESCRQGRA